MKFTALRPMIWTAKLEETIAYYTQVLGFVCVEINEDWGWATLQRDAVSLMVAEPNEHMPFEKPQFTGSFYFTVDDVDALWEQLEGHPSVYYELEDFEYDMREFAVRDNNGYILQFGTPLESFEDEEA